MLRPSRKTVLALEAVLDVAYNSRPDPVQSKDITKRQGIPQRYLEHVLQNLVHQGILKGVRGPRGGYTLARERRRITVGDIVRVVDNIDNENETEPLSQGDLGEKVIEPFWTQTRDDMLRRLDAVTIEELCHQAAEIGITPGVKGSPDYNI